MKVLFGSLQAHHIWWVELRIWRSWIQSLVLPVYSSRNQSLLAQVLCYTGDKANEHTLLLLSPSLLLTIPPIQSSPSVQPRALQLFHSKSKFSPSLPLLYCIWLLCSHIFMTLVLGALPHQSPCCLLHVRGMPWLTGSSFLNGELVQRVCSCRHNKWAAKLPLAALLMMWV